MKSILYLSLGLVAMSTLVAYGVFQRTETAGQRIQKLQQQIERERESVRVLRSEWAYLGRADRLEKFAEQHHGTLLLEPVLPHQLAPGPVRYSGPVPQPRRISDGADQ